MSHPLIEKIDRYFANKNINESSLDIEQSKAVSKAIMAVRDMIDAIKKNNNEGMISPALEMIIKRGSGGEYSAKVK